MAHCTANLGRDLEEERDNLHDLQVSPHGQLLVCKEGEPSSASGCLCVFSQAQHPGGEGAVSVLGRKPAVGWPWSE